MIHILYYCLFTVVVFAILLCFFWPGFVPLAVKLRIVNASSLKITERCCCGLCVLGNLSKWWCLCSFVLLLHEFNGISKVSKSGTRENLHVLIKERSQYCDLTKSSRVFINSTTGLDSNLPYIPAYSATPCII